MEDRFRLTRPSFQKPAIYRIVVNGQLNRAWSARILGMNITDKLSPQGDEETILVGRLNDQAELSGVLNTLYELHLPLISVECLESM